MPTYVYETLDEPVIRFEQKQSMRDQALTRDPESGRTLRRVMSGGFGFMRVRSGPTTVAAAPDSTCCPGCHD